MEEREATAAFLVEEVVVLDTRSLLFVRSKFFFSSVTRRRNEGALLKIH